MRDKYMSVPVVASAMPSNLISSRHFKFYWSWTRRQVRSLLHTFQTTIYESIYLISRNLGNISERIHHHNKARNIISWRVYWMQWSLVQSQTDSFAYDRISKQMVMQFCEMKYNDKCGPADRIALTDCTIHLLRSRQTHNAKAHIKVGSHSNSYSGLFCTCCHYERQIHTTYARPCIK